MRIKCDRRLLHYTLATISIWIIIELLYYAKGCKSLGLIIFGLVTTAISVLYLIKWRLIFSPMVLSDLMVFCLFLYQLKLVRSYSDLPAKAVITLLLCMSLWKFINIYNRNSIGGRYGNKTFDLRINRTKFKRCIYISFIIAMFFMIWEWFHAGGIPLFRTDGEIFRFNVAINGITHIFAILNKVIAVMVLAYFSGLTSRQILKEKLMLFILVISTVLIICTNMRSELVIIIFVGAVLFYIRKRPSLSKLLIFVIPLILFIGISPIIRKFGLYGNRFIMDQMAISTYPNLWFLTPFYQTLADSIRVFGSITEIFPQVAPFGMIEYNILPQIPFINLGRNVSDIISTYEGSSFYSVLTNTYLGLCYADGGLFLCIIYTSILAIWSRWLYIKYICVRNLKYTVLYLFMIYNVLMLSYGNTVIELSFICYYLYINLVFSLCNKVKKNQ